MSRYIDQDAVVAELEQEVEEADDWNTAHEIANTVKYFHATAIEDIIKDYRICGYTFKELIVFAEACQKEGITEENLVGFCTNVRNAYEYMINKAMEEMDKQILGL